MRKVFALTLAVMGIGLFACGGPAGGPNGTKDSGQSKLMDKSFAGKNACNPKNAERPFIIEWDATDMSSFEARASKDLVVVSYHGCDLKVLDNCNDDSVKGALGSYKAIDWTSGSMEKLEISDENELVAKLPLGVASLGGRVSNGEKFRMEYYVAGTRNATRDAVYRKDLDRFKGCKGATHFVYGYNLGAFALGSVTDTTINVDGSLYGFGAGAKKSMSTKADKQGGDLTTCKSDSAKEIEGCKVPVRLTLREISEEDNPDGAAAQAPETDAAKNLAGKLMAKQEATGKAGEHVKSAQEKLNARDGKGCLKELDSYDKLSPKAMSTDPKSGYGVTRGQCLMLAGQCDAGKGLIRKSLENSGAANFGPEQMDKATEGFVGMYCQGANMKPRDQLLKALNELNMGANVTKKDVATCRSNFETAKKLLTTVKPQDDDDHQIKSAPQNLHVSASMCLARAGDCSSAWKVFSEEEAKGERMQAVKDPAMRTGILKSTFSSIVQKCKDDPVSKGAAGEWCGDDARCTSGKCDKKTVKCQ